MNLKGDGLILILLHSIDGKELINGHSAITEDDSPLQIRTEKVSPAVGSDLTRTHMKIL